MTFDERFRALTGAFPCSVTSGKRSSHRNAEVGGVDNSLHLADLARDVVLDNLSEVVQFEALARRLGMWILIEDDHIHVQENL